MNMRKHATFGELLLRRRRELKLTQSQLAARIGCQPNYIVYLEKGERRPSDRTIRNVAEATGLDKADLYLAANPQVREFLTLDEDRALVREQLPEGLDALAADGRVRSVHSITDEEIDLLSSLRMNGRATTAEQYLTLVLTMRYVFG